MNVDYVIFAAEDKLSEAVATKILTNMGFEIARRPQKPRKPRLSRIPKGVDRSSPNQNRRDS